MNYGILVAVDDEGSFRIIGEVDSIQEAGFHANNYMQHASSDNLCPDHFEIHRRGKGGWYTNREMLEV